MKLLTKGYYRFKREYRDFNSYVCSQWLQNGIREEDIPDNWNTDESSPTLNQCISDWIKSKPLLFKKDLEFAKDPVWIKEAQEILNGSTTVFQKKVDLNISDLWHTDPLTVQRWPKDVHYSRFSVFHSSKDRKTDIRRLWELGRFGWALPLAYAYQETKKVEYARAWEKKVIDFIDSNPRELGPHWLNAMEPAMRVIQWCRAMSIFANTDPNPFPEDSPIYKKLLRSLIEHGDYIYAHLEWTPYGRTNHYISNLVGLLTLSIFIPKWKPAHQWQQLAKEQLTREIEIQTDSDGFHSEASTAYHHFVTELYVFIAALDQTHQLGFSSRFLGRVRQMLEVDQLIRGKENLDPRIGDDDSGALFYFSAASVPESVFPWKLQKVKNPNFFQLPQAGISILRSEKLSCIVSCGPNGQEGVGGHAHNDKLSFIIHHRNKALIVDSGTYCYSADINSRNRFRSTSSHNTILVDGKEQNPLEDWRMLRDETRAKRLVWEESEKEITFSGEHYGYESIGCIHKRTITLSKKENRLVFLDEILSEGSHTLEWFLHLSPEITRDQVHIESKSVNLPKVRLQFEADVLCEVKESSYSPVYGQSIPNLALVIKAKTQGPYRSPWVLELIS